MIRLEFTKATKSQSKLRLALFGPSGSGKTFTALRMAKGIGGSIAVIDTERGSASKYADRFDFSVLDLPSRDIDTYVAAIAAAQEGGFDTLIIDSLTHAWYELLDEVEKLARAKYKGNTWSAWSEGTPKQRALIDALLDFRGHIIATMRTKTEWTTQTDQRTGKSTPVRVGLAPEQGKGIEYEFDLLMELTTDHIATVIKDRTGRYQDEILDKPDESFGADLAAWLADAPPPPKAHWSDDDANVKELLGFAADKLGLTDKEVYEFVPEGRWRDYDTGKSLYNTLKAKHAAAAQDDGRAPEQIAEWVRAGAKTYDGANSAATDGQRGLCVAVLEGLFPHEVPDMRKQCRYGLLKFFWGNEVDSISKCTDAQTLAMLDWAGTEGASGKTISNPDRMGEAARIINTITESAGQQRLV